MGGACGPPTSQKVGPRESHKNVTKLVGGWGGGSGRSVKKWSLRFLKSKQLMVLKGCWQVCGFYEMLEHCWKRHFKQSRIRMHIQKLSWSHAPQTRSFQYPLLSHLGHAADHRDPCLLPLLKKSHQNDLKSLYHNVHEVIQIATTMSFAEASLKK